MFQILHVIFVKGHANLCVIQILVYVLSNKHNFLNFHVWEMM